MNSVVISLGGSIISKERLNLKLMEEFSEDSDEGRLLKTAFGGLAGILRYVPENQLNI